MIGFVQFSGDQVRVPLRSGDGAVAGQFLGNPDVPTGGVQDDRYKVMPERVWRDLPDHFLAKRLRNPPADDGPPGLCGHMPKLVYWDSVFGGCIAGPVTDEHRQSGQLPATILIQPASFI